MSLISLEVDSNDIIPPLSSYLENTGYNLDNKLILCDISNTSTSISGNNFKLKIEQPTGNKSLQKFSVLFNNNGLDPVITDLTINDVITITSIPTNSRDASENTYLNNKQDFVIFYESTTNTFTALSTIKKYNA